MAENRIHKVQRAFACERCKYPLVRKQHYYQIGERRFCLTCGEDYTGTALKLARDEIKKIHTLRRRIRRLKNELVAQKLYNSGKK